MKILVTGCAGFIGYHLMRRLQQMPAVEAIGLDNLNDYYEVSLKYNRLSELGFCIENMMDGAPITSEGYSNFKFVKADIKDKEFLLNLFNKNQFDIVYNLAAQAGVRYSLTNPYAYLDSNIHAFLNVLEACRKHPVKHLLFASSSSVYGINKKSPFSTKDNVDHPISLYAVTKKSNELMAHSYSYLYDIPCTGLRFFTVYGPWGRPDMALFKFAKNIIEGKEIEVFNNGNMSRDFTYVDDIIETLVRLMNAPPVPAKGELTPDISIAPYKIFNIGNNSPVKLTDFITEIETQIDSKAKIKYLPMQPGDVASTYADVSDLYEYVQFKPETSIKDGIRSFLNWFNVYYNK